MECSCIRGDEGFGFAVIQRACKYILLEDLSEWMDDVHYERPLSYDVEIKTPNSSGFVDVTIYTDRLNKISTDDLGIGGECLTDGIYCLKTKDICGVSYTSFFAVTYKIECCLMELMLRAETEKDWEELNLLRLKMEQIHEAARVKNERLAVNLYTFLRRLVSRKNCNC